MPQAQIDPAVLQKLIEAEAEQSRQEIESLQTYVDKIKSLSIGLSGVQEGLESLAAVPGIGAVAENAAEFLEETTGIMEQMSVMMGMINSFDTIFWLAVVQLMKDEADRLLAQQQQDIEAIIDLLREFDRRLTGLSVALEGGESVEVLNEVYRLVAEARNQMVQGRAFFLSGGNSVQVYINRTLEYLRRAERKLKEDLERFAEIPDIEEITAFFTFVNSMVARMLDRMASYNNKYTTILILVQGIYHIRENILEISNLVGREATGAVMQKIIDKMEEEILTPLGKNIFKLQPAAGGSFVQHQISRAQIVLQEQRYLWILQAQQRRIETFFDTTFTALLNLEDENEDYANLVESLRGLDYVNRDLSAVAEPMREIILRIRLPIESRLARSPNLVQALTGRAIRDLEALEREIGQVRGVLKIYGPYESVLTNQINRMLGQLGFGESPIINLGTGQLLGQLNALSFPTSGSNALAGMQIIAGEATQWTQQDQVMVLENKALNDAFADLQTEKAEELKRKAQKQEQENIQQAIEGDVAEKEQIIREKNERIERLEQQKEGRVPEEENPVRFQ